MNDEKPRCPWLAIENPVDWIWSFAPEHPAPNRPQTMADYPTRTAAIDDDVGLMHPGGSGRDGG